MPDESRPLEEPAIWADDELESSDQVELQWTESNASCQGRLLPYKRKSNSSKGSPKSQSPGLRKNSIKEELKVQLLHKKKSESSNSSSGSDGVIVQINKIRFPPFLPPSNNQSSQHPSTDLENCTPSFYSFTFGENNSSGPSVTSSFESLQETKDCVVCSLRANTCVMHHHQRHSNFCLDCATSCFSNSATCPLCPQPIVYIYKYRDV
uniref:Uncharacterized protein n=1 Tax=Graphocephala atropunctata TaxID=36148 RepID=A0A1B6M884_9HEMI